MEANRTEIKFQLYEGREKQSLLERYLNHDTGFEYKQDFINPYTGENIESKLMGSMRDHNPIRKDSEVRRLVFETDEDFGTHSDIVNLTELIKKRKEHKLNFQKK